MKLLDLERKGNVVRFYLGVDELEKWWGDDWDDAPYEHNAGPVYERFVLAEADAVFPFDCGLCNAHDILQPGETYQHKRGMPKEHYIKSDEPYLVALPDEPYCAGYASWERIKDVPTLQCFRLGMPWNECHSAIKAAGGFLIGGKVYKPEGEKDGN